MNIWEKVIFFFSCLLDGMIVPVMSLIYLEHGASVGNLAIYIALYSITVIILEVPSGMLSDVLGRKRIFILSHMFLMAYYITTLFSNSTWMLAFANIFHGIGRAFSSGSLEALLIDNAIEEQGEDNLKEINSQIIVLNSVALAVGAISGGIIGSIGTKYIVLLGSIIVTEVLLLIASKIFINEKRDIKTDVSLNEKLHTQLIMIESLMKSSDLIRIILFMSVTLAMNLALVEIYWQQKLLEFLPEHLGWIFGVFSCMGYIGLSMGSKIGEYISEYKDPLKVFWIFRMVLPCVIICLGQCFKWWMFFIMYLITYVVWGIGDLQEGTIFHQHVESKYRASMLSVKNLFIKGGCVATSLLSSMIIHFFELSKVWTMIPVLTFIMIFVCAKVGCDSKSCR